MVQLPVDFSDYTRQLMGEERFGRFLASFQEEPPVSIRLNPLKTEGLTVTGGERVPWCKDGYYLSRRPNFTMDPLLHAGCYYVQEAASMFVCHVLRQFVDRPVSMLDLCAAPGGKSTAAIGTLPVGSTLCSNEPVRNRFQILTENIAKWGGAACTVTNQYPRDFKRAKSRFDVILCDVPCSGEGMFRKDETTIREWSLQQVVKCSQLQRSIIADIWPCLNDGGLLIYSTCTFNTKENEENIRWILQEYEAEALPVDVSPEWGITGSLLDGFDVPVYRFIPGISRGEGLFVCVVRKKAQTHQTLPRPLPCREGSKYSQGGVAAEKLSTPLPTREGSGVGQQGLPVVVLSLSYAQAMAYLRGEALQLPADTPRGIVDVAFQGHVLGQVKNIGTRANNLYPKAWRVKTTHIPNEYEPVLRPK
jgi:16S rRNA C967 or C1407 C5-methylase (RsmB/RsmF family)